MFKIRSGFRALWIAATVTLAATTMPARAQQPTDEQRSAIRSSCRSDYMAHCASVPPGGLASLQCLQQNMASLSAACKSAVNAITPKAEPAPAKAEAPKAEPPKAEAAPAKTEAAPAKEPKPSATPKTAATPPPKAATAKPAVSAAKPAASSGPQTAAAPPLILRPMRPLEEVRVLRFACGADARTLCSAVQPGGGRIIQCLVSQPDALSAECKDVLGQFAAQ